MTEPSTVTGARRALGVQLAELRAAAGYTQTDLAPRVGYSRSTVANVEAGRQQAGYSFWRKCDEVLASQGALSAACEQIEALRRARHQNAATTAQREREAHLEQWTQGRGTAATTETHHGTGAALAIERALLTLVDHGCGQDASSPDDLEARVLDAYRQHDPSNNGRLSLVLVGGFAGSGKSEFARFLSSITGWTILDKDAVTRALVEQLLASRGGDINDRHTSLYLEHVRPFEYRCLMDAAVENLRCGVSTVLTAPFVREFADGGWLTRVQNRCMAHGAHLSVVWVKCDVESMCDYISFRGAARDIWKLNNWSDYLATIDPKFEPSYPHYTVDNQLNAAVAVADQARDIAARVQA